MEIHEVVSASPLRFSGISNTHYEAEVIRLWCRSGEFQRHTSCQAPGHIQANLMILPLSAAPSFFALCQRNPVPCPLLAYSKPGNPWEFISNLPGIKGEEIVGKNFDVRTDAPGYFVYENGKMIGEEIEVKRCFTKDTVAFLMGCSFSFERALAEAGLPPLHWSILDSGVGQSCPTYQTTIPLLPAGIFTNPGCMVVSMRPYHPRDIEKVRSITSQFGSMHGEPIAWGFDAVSKLGIKDIYNVDFGGPTEVIFEEGKVPVFWVSF